MNILEKIKQYSRELGIPYHVLHMQFNSVYGNGKPLTYDEFCNICETLINDKKQKV